jgi:lipopolysaccharide export system permease protein
MTRQIVTPLFVTLAIAAVLLLLERMLKIFDLVVNQGGPVAVVWKMLGALIPYYIGQALPFGLFLGVLLSFRKLSLNNEIDAFQSVGLGLPRLIRPAFIVAALLTVFAFFLYNYVQPYGRYTYRNLAFELSSGAFGASVRVGEFNKVGNGVTIRVDEVFDAGSRLAGIFVQKEFENSTRTTSITAREGTVLNTGDGRTLLLRLRDGVLIDSDPTRPTPTVLTFKMQDWPVELPEVEPFRVRGENQREKTIGELWQDMQNDDDKDEFYADQAAFHARIVGPLSIFFIPLLATPFGFLSKRTGRAFGLAVGFSLLLIYQKVLQFGEGFASLGAASPWLVLWGPLVLFAGGSGYLYWQSAYKVGANPFAWLEAIWDGLRALYVRLRPNSPAAEES